jgi:c-di-GMP-binding flagellar brake protein YcgR
MDNRRIHQRFVTSLSVEVYTGEDLVLATANNLSVGGLGLICPRQLPEKATVGVSMFLVEDGVEDASSEPINLRGEVIWCAQGDKGEYQAGLRFHDVEPQHQQAIQHFLGRLTGRA